MAPMWIPFRATQTHVSQNRAMFISPGVMPAPPESKHAPVCGDLSPGGRLLDQLLAHWTCTVWRRGVFHRGFPLLSQSPAAAIRHTTSNDYSLAPWHTSSNIAHPSTYNTTYNTIARHRSSTRVCSWCSRPPPVTIAPPVHLHARCRAHRTHVQHRPTCRSTWFQFFSPRSGCSARRRRFGSTRWPGSQSCSAAAIW